MKRKLRRMRKTKAMSYARSLSLWRHDPSLSYADPTPDGSESHGHRNHPLPGDLPAVKQTVVHRLPSATPLPFPLPASPPIAIGIIDSLIGSVIHCFGDFGNRARSGARRDDACIGTQPELQRVPGTEQ